MLKFGRRLMRVSSCALACASIACGTDPTTTSKEPAENQNPATSLELSTFGSQSDSSNSINSADQPLLLPQPGVSVIDGVLHFTWDPVHDFDWIHLLQFNAASQEMFPVFSTQDKATTQYNLAINALFFNWSQTRFSLQACKGDICRSSKSISPQQNSAATSTRLPLTAAHRGSGVGSSVAINRDAHTLVIGAPDTTNAIPMTSGQLQVFFKAGDKWHFDTLLHNPDLSENAKLGQGVVISDAADLIVASSPYHHISDNASGSVSVFERFGEGWVNTASIGADNFAVMGFGSKLALSGDAGTLAVCAFESDSIWLYQRVGSQWQFLQKLTLVRAANDTSSVTDLALSQDGRTLFAASSQSISIFDLNIGYYSPRAQQFPLLADEQQRIHRFATNDFGSTVVATVLEHKSDDTGAPALDTLFYSQSDTGDWKLDSRLRISQSIPFDTLPSLAMSADGHTLIVSTTATTHNPGYIHTYTKQSIDSGTDQIWLPGPLLLLPRQQLSTTDGAQDEALTTALALSGDGETMLLGVPREHDVLGLTTGAVYLHQSD